MRTVAVKYCQEELKQKCGNIFYICQDDLNLLIFMLTEERISFNSLKKKRKRLFSHILVYWMLLLIIPLASDPEECLDDCIATTYKHLIIYLGK